MDELSAAQRPRKRRAIHACANCRASKVRCDGQQPCQRCTRNASSCEFHDGARDAATLRVERLEQEVAVLRDRMGESAHGDGEPFAGQSATSGDWGGRYACLVVGGGERPGRGRLASAVDARLVTREQAARWYDGFFSGSQFLVPLFCERHDRFDSLLARSPFLFDTLLSIGCRAEQGLDSAVYRQLQSRNRDHLTDVLLGVGMPSVEDVQAMTLAAAYSDNGFVLIALALRFAIQLDLPRAVDGLFEHGASAGVDVDVDADGNVDVNVDVRGEQERYRLSRIWHAICNLELFFSLDGGKLPSIALQTSSRRIRRLLRHAERTEVDIRLLSQVELNLVRAEAYHRIALGISDDDLSRNDARIQAITQHARLELSLWLEEWIAVVAAESASSQLACTARQNLHIQHEWAWMTLCLKAVAASGIENIALMSNVQRETVRQAKDAATRHMQHMLGSAFRLPAQAQHAQEPTYLSRFGWTLDYVWAKCAVSVLLALKLAVLLRDPVAAVLSLLHDAHRVLEELKTVTVGHVAYVPILQASVEKCEAALHEYAALQTASADAAADGSSGGESAGSAGQEFQGYVPAEFVFHWDFPGMNLKHMALGWQEWFVNIDSLF